MIRKIISIKNIGRFENCCWRGGAQFESTALIYAENGRGKSTFCDVLRSFQTGTPDFILGRKRLGATGDCEAMILSEGGNKASFKAGRWDTTQPAIAIFDTTFIHQNVYAGDRIDHEQKKNLYRVIVGEEGVRLAKKVDDLDAEAREAGKVVSGKQEVLSAKLPMNADLKAFIKLVRVVDIAKKVTTKEEELKAAELALQKPAEIKAKGLLQEVAVPIFPADFEATLAERLPNLAEEAERQLRAHLAGHTKGGTEAWVSQGLGFQKDEACPFCGQSTQGLSLISAYRAFFDNAYDAFKRKLTVIEQTLSTRFNEKVSVAIQKTTGDNATFWEFWRQLGIGQGLELPDIDTLASVVGEVREHATALLKSKIATPLEAIAISDAFNRAHSDLVQMQAAATSYNDVVRVFNAQVNQFKLQQSAVDLPKLKSEIGALKLVELRHTPEIIKALDDYSAAERHKAKIGMDKDAAKTALDKHSKAVLVKHETRINELLKMFSAGFRIGGTESSFVGGKASSSYKLVINNVGVELGNEKTPTSTPSFRNTLSAGDKSTLALALFISQLERNPELKDKIVVFDDPFTSQDRSRRTATQSLICDLAKKVTQVFVLSHDPFFLRALWDAYKGGGGIKCFQFAQMANGTSVSEWEIEKETAGEYANKHRVLWDYCYNSTNKTSSAREVAQTIRPVLEEYLRLKLPHAFADNEWLGQFIDKIRNAPDTNPLAAAKVIQVRVEQINEYSKRYHHSSNPAADTELVDETELLTYVEMTLEVVGGF